MGRRRSREEGMGKGNRGNCRYGWTHHSQTGAAGIAQHRAGGTGVSARSPCPLPSVPPTPLCHRAGPRGAQAPHREPPSWDVSAFGVPQRGWGQWGGVPPLFSVFGAPGRGCGAEGGGEAPCPRPLAVGETPRRVRRVGGSGEGSLRPLRVPSLDTHAAPMKSAELGAGGGRRRGL